ncbi:hypothetical protein Taro_015992 [Colocasia esculenta]|uniref:Uncharacterized protein n=1 Tax=Colocasia esculenta TaxID=4460 RepID=A0A843UMC6_COLES|nr:hypothetical protein [Colocasia esculenta]
MRVNTTWAPVAIAFPVFERLGSGRDGLAGRDEITMLLCVANPVTTARAVATGSRQGRVSRPGRDGPMRRDLSSETGETSQQRQGVRRAGETGR